MAAICSTIIAMFVTLMVCIVIITVMFYVTLPLTKEQRLQDIIIDKIENILNKREKEDKWRC